MYSARPNTVVVSVTVPIAVAPVLRLDGDTVLKGAPVLEWV